MNSLGQYFSIWKVWSDVLCWKILRTCHIFKLFIWAPAVLKQLRVRLEGFGGECFCFVCSWIHKGSRVIWLVEVWAVVLPGLSCEQFKNTHWLPVFVWASLFFCFQGPFSGPSSCSRLVDSRWIILAFEKKIKIYQNWFKMKFKKKSEYVIKKLNPNKYDKYDSQPKWSFWWILLIFKGRNVAQTLRILAQKALQENCRPISFMNIDK